MAKSESLMPTGANHNPDVLLCLANLSNDEVFTPPAVANAMLDMLPQELFKNPHTTFLDPVCKSGIFLREITKRLMQGLEQEFPNKQKRLDHILHKQVFGIAITELTSLLARRTLYCAKYATSPFAITRFSNIEGNIRFKAIQHSWKNGRCIYCGASQSQYEREDMESHAYEFIHTDKPEEIFPDMKFDVIIGNPPYQLATAGDENGAQAKPIYQLFYTQLKKLNPQFISFIIPSRWFSGGWGLDEFRNEIMNGRNIREIHDFPNSSDVFPGLQIKGGVCYLLFDKSHNGKTLFFTHKNGNIISESSRYLKESKSDIIIRYNEAIPILHKITALKEESFESFVSKQRPFGLPTNYLGYSKSKKDDIILFKRGGVSFVDKNDIIKNNDIIDKYKIFITKAYGAGEDFPHQIINKPILAEPGTCCTETFLFIGPFKNINETKNVISYIHTKFFRFCVFLKKISQDALQKVYSFVPLQDFSKPWTDTELYAKYNLSQEEIDFIESMIKPMDLSSDVDAEAENV